MNFTWIDWLMVVIPVLIAVIITAYSRRYVRGVSDFLAGRRCAGRYLVSTAQSEAGSGPIGVVAAWQLMFVAGLAIRWWQMLLVITPLILALVGFVIYRYRQTRAMTMGQFYEIRYGKSFRIYAGMLTVLSGVVNFGIFPAVGSQFFVNFCGFPQTLFISGLTIPTYALLMVLLISLALLFTLVGGQLTIMATDCVEGLISWVFYLIIIFALLSMFSWTQISTALSSMPAGKSLLDPFDTGQIKDFNIWFVVIQVILCIYAYMSWQGGSGFNCSASSPHEAKMGAILGYWRRVAKDMAIVLLGICAFTYMNHPDFASGAAEVSSSLKAVGSIQVQNQMQAPMALAHFLPTGIKGMFCCIMLLGLLAGDGAYMHSWGSIFIQDVVVPFRKKPFTPRQHLRLLRWSIAGVGIFGFFFSLFFLQTEYIYMFFAMTGAIVAGAGSVILGGLYWKKGTHAAAWCSMTTGSALAVSGFVLKQVHLTYPFRGDVMLYIVNLNGQVMALIAAISAVLTYVLVSLLTCKGDFDMDRMLHRGQYAVNPETGPGPNPTVKKFQWSSLIGFDANFTRGDKIISGSLFGWNMLWIAVFLVGTVWNFFYRWPVSWWSQYWFISNICLPLLIGVVTVIWFSFGGVRDLIRMYCALRTQKENELDDGMVVNHHNLDEGNGNDVKK